MNEHVPDATGTYVRVQAGQGRAGQGRVGQGRAGQGRAGQGRAGQGSCMHQKPASVFKRANCADTCVQN